MKTRFENKLVFWFTGLDSWKEEILSATRKGEHVEIRATIENRYLQGGSDLQYKILQDENIPLEQSIADPVGQWTQRSWTLWEKAEGDKYTIGAKAKIHIRFGSGNWIHISTLRTKYWLERSEWEAIGKSLPLADKHYGERTKVAIGTKLIELSRAWSTLANERMELQESRIYLNRARLLRIASDLWFGEEGERDFVDDDEDMER